MPVSIGILATSLFDTWGERLFNGGAEKYLLDLVNLLTVEMRTKVDVFQPSKQSFERHINMNARVIGVPFAKINAITYIKLNRYFARLSQMYDIVHYHVFSLAYPDCHSTSIGLSHGIYWDRPINSHALAWSSVKRRLALRQYRRAAQNVRVLVANDTNFINWARIEWPEIGKKAVYIPNYVDVSEFSPRSSDSDNSVVHIVFPRRFTEGRGFFVAIKALESVLRKHANVSVSFVGEGTRDTEIEIEALKEVFGSRIEAYRVPFHKMRAVYRSADVVIVPTLFSEGTSLSCLEAMATGVPVIASYVGGLPNLVVDGFNGFLVSPSAGELERALERVILSPTLRKKMGMNGIKMAACFSKDIWKEKWIRVFERLLETCSKHGGR